MIEECDIMSDGAQAIEKSDTFYLRHGKRWFDVMLGLGLLPVLLPLILLISFGMVHRGHVFFVQERVGRGGKRFFIYKFRTMRIDAEAYLQDLCASDPAIAQEWNANQSLDPDPRITRVGKWLRRSKLDELPQIWNILRGDMSFVGPRPFLPSQQAVYDSCAKSSIYYKLRPGITGLWQISQKRNKLFVTRAKYDQAYGNKVTLLSDCKVIIKTAAIPFKMK